MRKLRTIMPIGTVFSRLTVIEDLGMINGKRTVKCICECGNYKNIVFDSLKSGATKSCGCLNKEVRSKIESHGLCKHPLYKIWSNILSRCYNPNFPKYNNYGGRGVVVCDEWKNNFKLFYDWCISNGWEKGLQIDKDKLSEIKPGKIYSPEFCSILTSQENANEKESTLIVTIGNESKSLKSWCRFLKIPYSTVRYRIYECSWDAVTALTTKSFIGSNQYLKKVV